MPTLCQSKVTSRENMPICSKCKHSREIARLSKICAECPGASCNFGKFVHIDAASDPGLVLRHIDHERLIASRKGVASRVNLADDQTIDLLLRVVAEFASLTDLEAPLVIRRLRGQTNVQIADGLGLTQAAVWRRWEILKQKNPIWGALDNGLIGQRGRRVRKTQEESHGR